MSDPTSGGLVPPFDPSQIPDYVDAQRKQILAQMLMGQAQQTQTPADWNNMKVVPRKGIFSTLAPLAASYGAGKALPQALEAQAKYTTGLFNDPQQQDPSQSAPQPPAAPPNIPPPLIRAPGYEPPAQAPAQTQGAPVLQNSMIPPGMSRQMAARIWSTLGPQGYAEKVLIPSQMGTPEWQTLVRAAHGDVNLAGQLTLMKAQNDATMKLRGGETAFQNGQPVFTAPQNGIYTTWDGGVPHATPIGGAAEAAARAAGQAEAAKNENTLGTIPSKAGGSTVGWLGSLLGPAPADRQQTPAMGLPGQPQPSPLKQEMPPQAAQPAPAAPAAPKPYFPSAAKEAPANPNDPWSNIPKLPTPTGLGAPDIVMGERLKHAGVKDAELNDKYGNESDLADQRLAFNKEALGVLNGADTGPLSDDLTKLRAKALQLGISPSWIPGADTVGNTQELKKFLLRNPLLNLKPYFGGKPGVTEFQVLKEEASPSPTMLKSVIARLVDLDSQQATYVKQRDQDYGKYRNMNGDPSRFEGWYSRSHSMENEFKSNPKGAPMNDLPSAAQYAGKRILDTTSNKYLRSDGKNWNPE